MDWLELLDRIDNNNVDDLSRHSLKAWLLQNNSYQRVLGNWWPHQGRNPSWDIEVRPCTIQDSPGLLLIEARVPDSSGKNLEVNASHDSQGNHIQICQAITQAVASLQLATESPWLISRDHLYQLSNRVAWAWRLAYLDILPVVLYYRGYQNGDGEVVPAEWWGRWMDIENEHGGMTPLLLLSREYEDSRAVVEAQ